MGDDERGPLLRRTSVRHRAIDRAITVQIRIVARSIIDLSRISARVLPTGPNIIARAAFVQIRGLFRYSAPSRPLPPRPPRRPSYPSVSTEQEGTRT